MSILRKVAGLIVPHSVVVYRRTRADKLRRERVARMLAGAPPPAQRSFTYDAAVQVLVERGLDEYTVRLGSMLPESLAFIRATIVDAFRDDRPLWALHVGNFVGVSLAAVASALREVHPESLTISVDPNIPHLGVDDPQSHALALLTSFGLQRSNLVVCGYTFEKTPGSDALPVEGYEVEEAWSREAACENALPNLARTGAQFDVAVLDGAHIGSYARRELELLVRLIRPGGLVFLDDVDATWKEIEAVFDEAAAGALPVERFDHDGRVGVLRRTA
jgi:hypothetical protein